MNDSIRVPELKPYQVMYWRPKNISKLWLWCSLLVAIAGWSLVQYWPANTAPDDQALMTSAADRADASMEFIANIRGQSGHRILAKLDPQGSHLIGPTMSMVTSKLGSLESKQTSLNPNYAAVVVRWLKDAGVQPGDRVAIGASGSWPALNIAVYAAVEAMQLRPTVILSAGSSQYGANSPSMMWVDMERALREAQCTSIVAQAASMGGLHDRASGMTAQTRSLLEDAIARNSLPLLQEETIGQSVDRRMMLFDAQAVNETYAAYINVGGGSASIGGTAGQQVLMAGLNDGKADSAAMPDCAAKRMLRRGVPVIHVGDAKAVALRYGFPIAPAMRPRVGEGNVYGKPAYRIGVVGLVMLLTCLAMSIIVAPGWPIQVVRRIRGGANTVLQDPESTSPAIDRPNLEWMV